MTVRSGFLTAYLNEVWHGVESTKVALGHFYITKSNVDSSYLLSVNIISSVTSAKALQG